MEKGKIIAKQKMIEGFLADGMGPERVAELMKMTLEEVKRLGKVRFD